MWGCYIKNMQVPVCRAPNVFLSSKPRWHTVKIFPPSCCQNRPFIHPSRPGLTPVFSLPYLPGLPPPISSSLILTPRHLPSHQTCMWLLSTFIILHRGNDSIAARHLSRTSRASQWHQYKPELTFCTDTSCQNMATLHSRRGVGGIYECVVVNEAGISQIKTARWSQGEVSALIYPPVETCRLSPIHSSAMPLLWQPVCKYLLTLTRTKQCHCTSRWFSLHVPAECVCLCSHAAHVRACVCVCVYRTPGIYIAPHSWQ